METWVNYSSGKGDKRQLQDYVSTARLIES